MNLLNLCTGNSARSILLESLLNRHRAGRVAAWSAGSHPVGNVHPEALVILAHNDYEISDLRSKSWNRFAEPNAPVMDAVITVSGNTASEDWPIWPGSPTKAHWGVEDPAAAERNRPQVFADTYDIPASRVLALLREPVGSMEAEGLGTLPASIGATS